MESTTYQLVQDFFHPRCKIWISQKLDGHPDSTRWSSPVLNGLSKENWKNPPCDFPSETQLARRVWHRSSLPEEAAVHPSMSLMELLQRDYELPWIGRINPEPRHMEQPCSHKKIAPMASTMGFSEKKSQKNRHFLRKSEKWIEMT